jgi:murein DD-endopeptidase MepM/ murein hydrolase activator NlpD
MSPRRRARQLALALAALAFAGPPGVAAEGGASLTASAHAASTTATAKRKRAKRDRDKPRDKTVQADRTTDRDRDKPRERSRTRIRTPAPSNDNVVPLVPVDPVARARAREQLTLARSTATLARARAQALIAYRLARRRSVEFLGDPARRAENARALDTALSVLKRSAFESRALSRELVLARAECQALETGDELPVASPAATSLTLASSDESAASPVPIPLALAWPARGTVVSGPGRRRDPATGTETTFDGVEILSRMNEPVRAVADGRVHRIAALPQGGYAVVMTHAEAGVSILSGLRQVDVAPGTTLTAGQPLGLVGRDLDGAPVLTFELWRAGAPVDPRPLLPEK